MASSDTTGYFFRDRCGAAAPSLWRGGAPLARCFVSSVILVATVVE